MDTEPLLLISALMLACAWIGYRAERQQHHEAMRDLMHRPSDSAALLSAMHAALQRLERATDAKRRDTRKTEPLPGTQAKPRKSRAK